MPTQNRYLDECPHSHHVGKTNQEHIGGKDQYLPQQTVLDSSNLQINEWPKPQMWATQRSEEPHKASVTCSVSGYFILSLTFKVIKI